MTLKNQLVSILREGRKQGKSDDWMALAILHWMDSEVAVSLSGNGWLEDDEATASALDEDYKELMTFIRTARSNKV